MPAMAICSRQSCGGRKRTVNRTCSPHDRTITRERRLLRQLDLLAHVLDMSVGRRLLAGQHIFRRLPEWHDRHLIESAT